MEIKGAYSAELMILVTVIYNWTQYDLPRSICDVNQSLLEIISTDYVLRRPISVVLAAEKEHVWLRWVSMIVNPSNAHLDT